MHANEDLTRLYLGNRRLLVTQNLRAAELVQPDCPHRVCRHHFLLLRAAGYAYRISDPCIRTADPNIWTSDPDSQGSDAVGAGNTLGHLLAKAGTAITEQMVEVPPRDIARRADAGLTTLLRHTPAHEALPDALLRTSCDEPAARAARSPVQGQPDATRRSTPYFPPPAPVGREPMPGLEAVLRVSNRVPARWASPENWAPARRSRQQEGQRTRHTTPGRRHRYPDPGAPPADGASIASGQTSRRTGFMLAGAMSVGLTSRIGDIIGHRRVLMALAMTGLCGAVIGAVSNGFVMLLIGRVLLGLAVTTPLAWGLMRARARAEQVQSAALALGTITMIFTAVSLLLGGVLVTVGASWQSVFWVIAVAYCAMLILALRVPETPPTTRERVALDWPGAIGLGIWLAALLLALSEGGTDGWGSPHIVTLLAISALAFLVWVVQQRRSTAPLMDFRDMNIRQMTSGYVAIFTTVLLPFALYILLPTMLQAPVKTGYGHGLDLLQAALPLVMILPGSFTAAWLGNFLLTRRGPQATIITGGLTTMTAFLGMAFLHDDLWPIYLWVFLYGVGSVMCYNLGWSLVAASGRQDNTSITFGVLVAGQMTTASVINAIVLAILNLGASTLPTESTYTGLYTGIALTALIFFVAFGIFIVPKKLEDRHAITPHT